MRNKFNHIAVLLILIIVSCNTIDTGLIYEQNEKVVDDFISTIPDLIEEPPLLNPHYLEADDQIIKNIINKLPYIQPTYNNYKKYCSGFSGDEVLPSKMQGQIELGFGLKKSSDVFYGGYGSYYIDILHDETDVLFLDILLSYSQQDQLFIKTYVLDKLNFKISVPDETSLRYQKKYSENIKNFQRQSPLRIDFDSISFVQYSTNEQEMYKLLSNPLSLFSYDCRNLWCGEYMAKPFESSGRVASDSLAQMKSYELLEKSLFSSNPVGRIYALEKLQNLIEADIVEVADSIATFMDTISNLNLTIGLCEWCPIKRGSGPLTYKELISRLDEHSN